MLGSGLETHVAEISGDGDNSLKKVSEHEAVDLAVLCFVGSAGPGDIKNVSNISEMRKL
jgi:hypothetical protein